MVKVFTLNTCQMPGIYILCETLQHYGNTSPICRPPLPFNHLLYLSLYNAFRYIYRIHLILDFVFAVAPFRFLSHHLRISSVLCTALPWVIDSLYVNVFVCLWREIPVVWALSSVGFVSRQMFCEKELYLGHTGLCSCQW